MTDKRCLEGWYQYAAYTSGFIGGALRAQRSTSFQVQEQQRSMIGIKGQPYDVFWVRLQAMPLPQLDHCAEDLARIVLRVQQDLDIAVDLDLAKLEELIRDGLTSEVS